MMKKNKDIEFFDELNAELDTHTQNLNFIKNEMRMRTPVSYNLQTSELSKKGVKND